MNLTLLSRTVGTISLIAALSTLVGTSVQQPAQSQTQNRVSTLDDGNCVPLPQGTFYQEFGGITFSSEQKIVYHSSMAELGKTMKSIIDAATLTDDPDRSVDLWFNDGIGQQKTAEISAMLDALMRDQVPGDTIVELINEKYGEYATAEISQYMTFTPEQIAAGQQAGLDFEADMMSGASKCCGRGVLSGF